MTNSYCTTSGLQDASPDTDAGKEATAVAVDQVDSNPTPSEDSEASERAAPKDVVEMAAMLGPMLEQRHAANSSLSTSTSTTAATQPPMIAATSQGMDTTAGEDATAVTPGASPSPPTCTVPLICIPQACAPNPNNWLQGLSLRPEHREHLHASWLTDETIDASGIKSADAAQLETLGFAAKDGPAMVIPYPHRSLVRHYRIRPDNMRDFQAEAKYRTRPGDGNHLYIPLTTWEVAEDTSAPLLIAEGEKKALAAMQVGFNSIGVPGVYGWRSKEGPIVDLGEFKWQDRRVTICYDSDVWTNPNVREALRRLVQELEHRGAEVFVVFLPHGEDGNKMGVDDYLVANGAEQFKQLVDGAKPLADVAMALVKPGLSPNRLQEVMDYVGRVIAVYPAAQADY